MFSSSIKTTFYRKINETANRILLEDIKEIYYMTTYICLSYLPSYLKMTSKERAVYSNKELLVFIKVDSNLNEEEYSFDEQELKDPLKVINILNYRKKGLYYGKSNMLPIIEAFRKKKMKR